MTVGIALTVVGWIVLAIVVGAIIWVTRYQRRQYPKDRERLKSDGDPGWLMTKFTWLSGGRG
jgi:hypothetical protein